MHRFILGNIPDGMVVDHINRNGLDNRKEILRIVTCRESINNSIKRDNAHSKFRGVYKHRDAWTVHCMIKGKQYYLGRFTDEKIASEVYEKFLKDNQKNLVKTGESDTKNYQVVVANLLKSKAEAGN